MNEYIKTEINSDGLRYKSRPTGSPFGPTGHAGAIMSCFKCGKRKPRTQGANRMLVGKQMFGCFDCYPAKTPEA
jgi:hypothetical protein